MENAELENRLVKIEERSKSNTHRLNDIETLAKSLNDQNIAIRELIIELKHVNKSMTDHENRLDVIEKRPADKMSLIINTIISTIAGALTTGAVAALIFFMKG